MANDIKGKLQEMHDEILCARNLTRDIIGDLESCDENTNLTQKIGIYAREMPDFNYLAGKRAEAISHIRGVCTGELSISLALEYFRHAEKHLNESLKYFKL